MIDDYSLIGVVSMRDIAAAFDEEATSAMARTVTAYQTSEQTQPTQ